MPRSKVFPGGSLLLAVSLVAGCDAGGSAPNHAPIVRDSSGVRIVENVGPKWSDGDAWTLSAEPVLRVGVVEGEPEYMFSGIGSPQRLADGSILMFDRGSYQLRIFDSSGRFVRSIGRRGDGPGEFQGPVVRVSVRNDSIYATDALANRVTVLSLYGSIGSTFAIDPVPGFPGPPNGLVPLDGGGLLTMHQGTDDEERWITMTLVRHPLDGRDPEIVVAVNSLQCHPGYASGCTLGGVYASGTPTHVLNNRIYTSRPDLNEVRIMNMDGDLIEVIRGASGLQPVTAAMRDEFIEAAVAADPAREAETRAGLVNAFFDFVPGFLTFMVSTDGDIWTQEYAVEKSAVLSRVSLPQNSTHVRWTVYDPDGGLLGDVMVPANLTVAEIGNDYLLGVSRDELGVERIEMYAVVKP